MIKLDRTQIVLLTLAAISLFFFYSAYRSESVIIDWNDFFNGVLRDSVAVVIGTFFTIIVYRYAYHRRNKA